MDQSGTRLNKLLAIHLGIGRREADDLIAAGKVLVNGQKAILGARVQLNDQIVANGKAVATDTKFIYVVMNKPTGYVCSKRQQGDTPTIYSLLPPEYQSLKTVGRLDKDSSGIILLTNDGDFAHKLTHPSFAKVKKYEVALDKPLTVTDLEALNRGVQLEDGVSHLHIEPNGTYYQVTMHEGRNRQIRRTFAALGYTVTRLRRTQFGDYTLDKLDNKEHRFVGVV